MLEVDFLILIDWEASATDIELQKYFEYLVDNSDSYARLIPTDSEIMNNINCEGILIDNIEKYVF